MNIFEFYRFRFHFRALDAVRFPAGKSANTVRGAFGMALRDRAAPAAYARLFEPRTPAGARAPSGLTDWPRPFVLRAAHLDGRTIPAGSGFFFDAHVFDLGGPASSHSVLSHAVLSQFRAAFAALAESGIGIRRGRACLELVEQLDLDDRGREVTDQPLPPTGVLLDADAGSADRVHLRFLTPTELKDRGGIARKPEFPMLFGRLRDRLSTLRALYGPGPLDVDFRGMGERAGSVSLGRCELAWERIERRSGRTGEVHPIGGFTGEAEYHGPVAEFLPWLRAARWVGVGRQTVWGKGDVRVVIP